jgi:RsiW-degrading membrane proteinase PrsW (M82 family)
MNVLLIALSILPVILLMIYIYRQDKYQKEPIRSLIKAFVGGLLSIPLDLFIIYVIIHNLWVSDSVFYSAFWEAGFPEELSKLIIFLIFIWDDRNFDEWFDGIIYAAFIGLGFACWENIDYVVGAGGYSLTAGVITGVERALLSVPGHFLFGVIMGYFLSMAKFHKEKSWKYILIGFLAAAGCHGLFDWILMYQENVSPVVSVVLTIIFYVGDFFLWKLGLKYIRKQQENSRAQAEEAQVPTTEQ